MKRREFLNTVAVASAAATVPSSWQVVQAAPRGGADPRLAELKWDKAPCRFCGTGCHVDVGVKDGKVVAVAGSKAADVNKGLLCVKGYQTGMILYGQDRLTKPLLRKNGKLEPVSWEEAIDAISKRVLKDPKGFAFYGSGQWTIVEGYLAQKFMKGGLANNHIDPNARLCMASAVTGFLGAYGVDEPAGTYDDLDAADVVITWGNNPAEMHPVLFSRIVDRRLRGDKVTLIDIGTRRTRTTEHAQHYMEFKPQSDLAIANGIAHLLIKNNTYDADFVANHCNFRGNTDPVSLFGKAITFDEYKASIAKYTPEYVSEISGLKVEDIHLLAKLFGDRKLRITSLWCMGMNQHTRGTAINTLVHGVHLLSGHFGQPGDAPTSLTGQPSACGTVREVGTLAHALPGGRIVAKPEHREYCEKAWKLPAGKMNPKPGYHTVKMWDHFTKPTAEGGDIHTIWVQVTNPAQTLPNLKKLVNDKAGLDDKFLIVSDVYPTVTTELADLVLPSAMWVEKNGVFGNSERRTQQWFKMVDPPGEARDDTWQILAAAHRLYEQGFAGMKDAAGDFLFRVTDDAGKEIPSWSWEAFKSFNVDRFFFEEYRPFTHMKHKNVAPYDVLATAHGMRWPVVQDDSGTWRETRWRFTSADDPFVTTDKRVQFYHSTTKDDKAQIWFHPYEPAAEPPDKDYPFWLCTGRVLEHWHSGTMTMRVPPLRRAMPHAYVEMHATDAAKLGVASGGMVEVETRRGTLTMPAMIDKRGKTPEGSLFVPFFDERLLINELTIDAIDPISKQPDYKKCAARVRRAGGTP